MRRGTLARRLAAAAALGIAAVSGSAQPEPDAFRPETSERLVKRFDFEERAINPLEIPFGWLRGQNDPLVRERPGFPNFTQNHARLVYDASVAFAGEGCVEVPVAGGSSSLLLREGVIPIFPSADYLVGVMVQTDGLRHAAARLVASLLDGDGRPIPGSAAASPPTVTGGVWRPLSVTLRGLFPEAAFLHLELVAVQPERFETTALPEELTAWRQDFDGLARFDEVTVLQLPRVQISTAAPAGTTVAPHRPVLDVLVRDLTGERLAVRADVWDADGALTDSETWTLAGGVLTRAWTPHVDAYGWYRASIRVTQDGRTVGGASTAFAYVPPSPQAPPGSEGDAVMSADREALGVDITTLPEDAGGLLARAVVRLGAGTAAIPLLEPGVTAETLPARVEFIGDVGARLLDELRETTLVLAALPPSLAAAARIDATNVLGLFAAPRDRWQPALDLVLRELGDTSPRWRLGRAIIGGPTPESAPSLLEAAVGHMSRLVPGLTLETSWRSDRAPIPAAAGARRRPVIEVAAGTPPAEFASMLAPWLESTDGSIAEAAVSVTAPDPDLVGPRAAAAAVARDLVRFWEIAFPADDPSRTDEETPSVPRRGRLTAFFLRDPVVYRGGHVPTLLPTPAGVAFRGVGDRLVGRRLDPLPDLAPGVRGALLVEPAASEGEPVGLVLWREGGGDTPVRLRLGLGEVSLVDIFGNSRPAPEQRLGPREILTHEILVGDEPVFVEGVDEDLLRFQLSMRIEPPRLVSRPGVREHRVVFENPWSTAVRGRFYVAAPGGYREAEGPRAERSWRIAPRLGSFTIPSGDSTSVPLAISFSAAEDAGPKLFAFDVELGAHEEYGLIRIERMAELGLDDIEFQLIPRREPDAAGPDYVVEAAVTNRGDEPVTVNLLARADGYARQRAVIGDLAPGQTARRVFAFKDAATVLAGSRVHVGLSLSDGEGRLRRSVEIPPLR